MHPRGVLIVVFCQVSMWALAWADFGDNLRQFVRSGRFWGFWVPNMQELCRSHERRMSQSLYQTKAYAIKGHKGCIDVVGKKLEHSHPAKSRRPMPVRGAASPNTPAWSVLKVLLKIDNSMTLAVVVMPPYAPAWSVLGILLRIGNPLRVRGGS